MYLCVTRVGAITLKLHGVFMGLLCLACADISIASSEQENCLSPGAHHKHINRRPLIGSDRYVEVDNRVKLRWDCTGNCFAERCQSSIL